MATTSHRLHFDQELHDLQDNLLRMASLVDSGKIRPVVSAVFPLADIRAAHELVEARHTAGKVVLQVVP